MLKNDGWVSPSLFTKFNMVTTLNATESHVLQALRNIHTPPLEFQESDGSGVLVRITGGMQNVEEEVMQLRKDEEDRTIYVEPLCASITRTEIEQLFSPFGKLLYISIPRFKDGRCKGFCFIEFATCESAKEAVDSVNHSRVHSEKLNGLRALMRAEWRRRKDTYKDAKKQQRIEAARRRHSANQTAHLRASLPPSASKAALTSTESSQKGIPAASSNVTTNDDNTSQEEAAVGKHNESSGTEVAATRENPPIFTPSFERGVILSISGLLSGEKKPTQRFLYECLSQFGDVAFIDFTPRVADICKARFTNAESAAKARAAFSVTGGAKVYGAAVKAELLEGQAEEEYWRHIHERRKARDERRKQKREGRQERRVEGRIQPRRRAKNEG